MPKLTDLQDADRQYDPYSNEHARDLLRQDNEAGLNSGADSPNTPAADSGDSSRNIDATNRAEQEAGQVPNQYGWDESKAKSAPKQSFRAKATNFAKKRGGVIAIGGGVIGVPSIILMLLSPSLLLVQMSEILTGKFNDQLTVLDKRSNLILKKKLKTQTIKGICGKTISIKCKYRTISKNQAKRLKAAGLEPLNGEDVIEGRGKPTKFRFNGEEITADKLLDKARSDPALRSALRKGYNPAWAAWADANAFKVLGKLGIKKSSSVDPSSDKEKMKEQLKEVAKSGDLNDLPEAARGKLDKETDGDGKVTYTDSAGNVYSEAEGVRINNLLDESIKRGDFAKSLGKTALKQGVKGVLTSAGFGAGAVDSLCTVWNTVRIAGFAAKIYQQRQLIRYAYEFNKQADAIKAGDGKAETSTFFNDILTSTNAEGKSATDSAGYRFAAYNDVFKPNVSADEKGLSDADAEKQATQIETQNETAKYVNGQLISDSLMAKLANSIAHTSGSGSAAVDAADSSCHFVKSLGGQAIVIGLAAAGLVAAVFSGGATLTWGAALQGAAGVTMGVVFALLQPKLIDMAKGEIITGNENGNEAGNAIASGQGGLNAQASQTRGIPLQTKGDYAAYSKMSAEVAADYAEVDRYEHSPFDPTSKNTFVGSIVASILPQIADSKSVGSGLLNAASLITTTAASVISPKSGAEATTEAEFSQCSDPELEKWDIAADPFCNPRYGMKENDLAIDPEKVVDYMVSGGYIVSETDPTPAPGSAYEDYVKKCIERETPIGDSTDGGYDGEMCVDGRGDQARNTMFRLMYVDTTVDEGMETDYSVANANAPAGDATEFTFATYNLLHADSHPDDSRKVGGCAAHPVAGDENCAKTRTARQVEIINGGAGNPAFDILATQETSPQQFNILRQSLTGYDSFPQDTSGMSNSEDGAVSVFWNKSKFSMFASGKYKALSNTSKNITTPWVGLQTSGGQKLYVTSIHYANSTFGGTAESIKKSAELTIDWVKDKVGGGATVIVGGDFNDQPSQKLSYCVYTRDGLMAHAQNMQAGQLSDPNCTKLPDYNGIDHIYATPNTGVSVTAWKHMDKGGIVGQASDHTPSYATFQFPGADGSSSTGGDVGGSVSGDDFGAACAAGKSLGAPCDGQCVSFVKYRLVKHGILPNPPGSLGNGRYVVGTLRQKGFETGTVARVNSVFSTAQTSQPQYGHTGMVSQVKPDGSIVIEEYNFNNPKHYGTRTMTKAEYEAKGYTFAYVGGKYK